MSDNGGVNVVVSIEGRGVCRGRGAKLGSVLLDPAGRSSEPFRATSAFAPAAAAAAIEIGSSHFSNGPAVPTSNSGDVDDDDDDDERTASSLTMCPSARSSRSGRRRTRLEGVVAVDDDGGVGHVSTTVGG